MSNVDVSEAGLTTAYADPAGNVEVAEAGLSTAPTDGAGGTAYVDVAEAGLSIGGNVDLIPMWRLDHDTQEWVPLTGDVYMLRAGKWVLL
ncbi:hypothetical protein [Segeticoccus rhizosphaerae]|uniref:hypothetical protein n=1 Tax=Segeticoccus rhizosphaerae TaxID=1104777 RepID=UPI001265359A|nr:hypothetical protein [Segeticoccus rhizosphaerae]